MYRNYVCKLRVSTDAYFYKVKEVTAFGYFDGENNILVTAAHIVTDLLGCYPASNQSTLYVEFENHNGVLHPNNLVATFVMSRLNNQLNFNVSSPFPFFDIAEIKFEGACPVTQFFGPGSYNVGDHIEGVGFPVGSQSIQVLKGNITNINHQPCTQISANLSVRSEVNHNSQPGCSGGPYIIMDAEENPCVIGCLIGSMSLRSNSPVAIQCISNLR
ncbi:hypothetical protein [Psychromonas aquimarina]|uniref:hypothetical protein n=1 Tax=Psychromonas aquimarina TaxID=444919 RepID=UPI0004130CBC|nr:hypothetical protein [Psychromonas aquimarina]